LKLFNRSKFISGEEIDEFIIKVEASLLDTVHEIELSITVDLRKLEIIDARSSMLRVPYSHCYKVEDLAKNLIGLNVINKGRSKSVFDLIGGKQGCLIMVELAKDALTIMSQTAVSLYSPENFEQNLDVYTRDTCYTHCLSVEEKIKAACPHPYREIAHKKQKTP
jgi:hypothetical protein